METRVILLCIVLATSLYILNNHFVDTADAEPLPSMKYTFLNGTEQQSVGDSSRPFLGVNMRGYYTSMPQMREGFKVFPTNYYESSFETLASTGIMDHVRYRFYWEAYERNSTAFLKEIKDVAKTADKYGIKVIYDNHQFHTSSWLNLKRGTGFPAYLFNDTTVVYEQGSGGAPKSKAAVTWWSNWWNRDIRAVNGTDGWILQLEFLKRIVSTVDKHPSTLGYEILSEPQVHNEDQWTKIGKYNTFMTNELRKITDKTLVYSMNIPIDLKSTINVTSSNLVKMFPHNKENAVFKFSLYGIPSGGYQSDKLQLFENASRIAGIPVYIGEWNNIKRVETYNEKGEKVWEIDETLSDISQTDANKIVGKFKEIGIWGLAYWEWSFVANDTPNFNLVNVTYNNQTGTQLIQPTEYFTIIKNAYAKLFGQSLQPVIPIASKQASPY